MTHELRTAALEARRNGSCFFIFSSWFLVCGGLKAPLQAPLSMSLAPWKSSVKMPCDKRCSELQTLFLLVTWVRDQPVASLTHDKAPRSSDPRWLPVRQRQANSPARELEDIPLWVSKEMWVERTVDRAGMPENASLSPFWYSLVVTYPGTQKKWNKVVGNTWPLAPKDPD